MKFTVYDETTGEIISNGVGSEAEAMAHERDGRKVILGKAYCNSKYTFNPLTLRPNKIKGKHIAERLFEIHTEKLRELAKEISFKDHQIGITDVDMIGWKEVDDFFRLVAPSSHVIETNTGKLEIKPSEWAELYSSILRARQTILNRAFDSARTEVAKCK